MDTTPETMSDFFDRRVDTYEAHMLNQVTDAVAFYHETALLVSAEEGLDLLDLGCGTGLELDEIFKMKPDINVTGIDLSTEMLERLQAKHTDKAKQLHLINGSYFDIDLGYERFTTAVSVQTMHHFTYEKKRKLYSKIYRCLRNHSCYIETDYTARSQQEEDAFLVKRSHLKSKQDPDGKLYHIDIPCTVGNQLHLLQDAGFEQVTCYRRYHQTALFIAKKLNGASV
ncbi:MAG: class I SAM-dependent methyltransferase [Sporolactobacillus sp.]